MSKQADQSQKLTVGALFFTFSLIIGVAAYSFLAAEKEEMEVASVVDEVVTTQEVAPPENLTSRFMIFGDVMWGRRNQTLAEANGGPSYLFEGFESLNKSDYDAWLINLECPVTNTEVSQSEQERLLKFNCQPEYLDEAAKWFDIASLANNHTDNVNGESGLVETRWQLEDVGIQPFGHYDNAVLDELCDVVSLPARTITEEGVEESVALPVALCGYHNVFQLATEQELAVIQRYSDIMPTIVMPHMGAEYEPTADLLREQQFRAMVDNGADLVVGGHPHWVQNTEVYKDTLIVYSLGNFLFDQAWSEEVQQGMGLDVTLTTEYSDNIEQWVALGESCATFGDDCLEQARADGLQKYDFNLSYDVVATQYRTGQTKRGNQSLQEQTLIRTNWAQTLQELGQ